MPLGIGHDDKDPGSMNLDIGYIETNHNGYSIYKPYLRRCARVYPGSQVDFVNRRYYLVKDNGTKPEDAVARINIAVLTGRTPGESIKPYLNGDPLTARDGVDGTGNTVYFKTPGVNTKNFHLLPFDDLSDAEKEAINE